MLPMPDDEVIAAMWAEFERKAAAMELVMQPLTVLQLTGLLQLAMRHPDLSRNNHDAGMRFVTAAREYFADCPMALDVIRRGFDPREDR